MSLLEVVVSFHELRELTNLLSDRFPNSIEAAEKAVAGGKPVSSTPCDLTLEVRALHAALKPQGRTFWRTSAINPWYAEVFRREGFTVERIHAREIGHKIPIDRVSCNCNPFKELKLNALLRLGQYVRFILESSQDLIIVSIYMNSMLYVAPETIGTGFENSIKQRFL